MTQTARNDRRIVPNLFLVGAAKCGTEHGEFTGARYGRNMQVGREFHVADQVRNHPEGTAHHH